MNELPRKVLIALGLMAAGCKKEGPVHPCLKVAVEPEPVDEPDPVDPIRPPEPQPEDPPVGPCLKMLPPPTPPTPVPKPEPPVGPCLDFAPCLSVPPDEEPPDPQVEPDQREARGASDELIERLVESGALAPDVAERLSSRRRT